MERSDPRHLENIGAALNRREADFLSPQAAVSSDGRRRTAEPRLASDYRQTFSLDVDRIMHSLAYTRYIDKTQVFYLIENDHITHRVLHVQLVSKIARTIGRFLGLNEDLIEAVALGHDIGHAPFGHDGERFLSGLCEAEGIGHFYHSVQSVHFLESVERKGKGWNLCLQTLDGILCHDGEIHNQTLRPDRQKDFDQLDAELSAKKMDPRTPLVPMTLEGCVVRFADTISYIGRDIEDAIRLGVLARSDLPRECARVLGDTNGTIVYTLVTDVIRGSYGRDHIAFSPEVSEALLRLKRFNLERIYMNPIIKRHTETIRDLFTDLFHRFLTDIETGDRASPIFTGFLDGMSAGYISGHRPPEIVRDFIAGMTDQYFLKQCPPDRASRLGMP
jgi:dGTPase